MLLNPRRFGVLKKCMLALTCSTALSSLQTGLDYKLRHLSSIRLYKRLPLKLLAFRIWDIQDIAI